MHSKPTQLLCRHLINYCADTRGVTAYPRGRRRGWVGVDEHADVLPIKAEAVDEAAAHPGHVVEASLELVTPTDVVDAHQRGVFLPDGP